MTSALRKSSNSCKYIDYTDEVYFVYFADQCFISINMMTSRQCYDLLQLLVEELKTEIDGMDVKNQEAVEHKLALKKRILGTAALIGREFKLIEQRTIPALVDPEIEPVTETEETEVPKKKAVKKPAVKAPVVKAVAAKKEKPAVPLIAIQKKAKKEKLISARKVE
ncbi:TPA_asm: hypothetical protein [Capsaspora MELD virus 2]|nr:TPA_asm: hypothetical protein [Capsaspora MELD virus 2]